MDTKLYQVKIDEKQLDKKNGLTYWSWSWAWTEVLKLDNQATYEVVHFDNKPYIFDENLGYMVQTKLTLNGQTKSMYLPVMDGANKAQKHIRYTYTTKYGEKTVEPATMFDINTAIMRCLVKNIAMFGLGLYIYAGEDLPEGEEERMIERKAQTQKDLEIYQQKLSKVKSKEEFEKVNSEYKKTGKEFDIALAEFIKKQKEKKQKENENTL